jgi:hypothetical protein
MAFKFNPLSLLFLKFRGRSVAVLRDHCTYYDVSRPHQSPVAVPDSRPLMATEYHHGRTAQLAQSFTSDDLVLLASIPGYPDTDQVELTKAVWPSASAVVQTVTIALESGAPSMASGLFPTNDPTAAAVD